jgi:hypothetical protein
MRRQQNGFSWLSVTLPWRPNAHCPFQLPT